MDSHMHNKNSLPFAVAFLLIAFGYADSLRAADARATPPANDQYRVINGTTSPNGRYAIALGLDKKNIDWKSLYQKPVAGGPGSYSVDPDKDDKIIRNYVVDQ